MGSQRASDLLGVLKGLQQIVGALVKEEQNQISHVLKNSSVTSANSVLQSTFNEALKGSANFQLDKLASETLQRGSMVFEGLRAYAKYVQGRNDESSQSLNENSPFPFALFFRIELYTGGATYEKIDPDFRFERETIYEDVENLFKLPLKEPISLLNSKEVQNSKADVKRKSFGGPKVSENYVNTGFVDDEIRQIQLESLQNKKKFNLLKSLNLLPEDTSIDLTTGGIKQSDSTAGSKSISSSDIDSKVSPDKVEDKLPVSKETSTASSTIKSTDTSGLGKSTPKPVARKAPKKKPVLSETAKQRSVPSSRLGRMFSFGSLAAGLGVGTVTEFTMRQLGLKEPPKDSTLDSVFLTPANAERIVKTLCEVRGAALKIGQILSIQDNNVISPQLQKAFERVRQSADFMPAWQVEKVMKSSFGSEWRKKLSTFDMKPFAAASIGQVHPGTLLDGTEVAIKIQYPGVAEGIESDIENLVGILKIWSVFPEGLFIENLVEVAKRELSWEVDYVREAECTKKFRELLKPYPEYYVPKVIDELSGKQVFTTELIEGIPVDKCQDLDEKTRIYICGLVMQLCLREVFQFQFMQTDPNWSNFFYNPDSKQLILLDFGASRSYDKKFIDEYINVIKAAADGDRKRVLELSRKMKFLTGYESKMMEDAHVDTVMILGEVFREGAGDFDFGRQDTTKRIQKLVPTILTHRLCPPPEEIYSLHRKLSGVFLLCSKLKVKMNCRKLFLNVYDGYKFG